MSEFIIVSDQDTYKSVGFWTLSFCVDMGIDRGPEDFDSSSVFSIMKDTLDMVHIDEGGENGLVTPKDIKMSILLKKQQSLLAAVETGVALVKSGIGDAEPQMADLYSAHAVGHSDPGFTIPNRYYDVTQKAIAVDQMIRSAQNLEISDFVAE